jgi:hypothetical protein
VLLQSLFCCHDELQCTRIYAAAVVPSTDSAMLTPQLRCHGRVGGQRLVLQLQRLQPVAQLLRWWW